MFTPMFHGQNRNNYIYTYGYLYNCYAITNEWFAPAGWKLPSSYDYENLATELSGSGVAGGKMKSIEVDAWDFPNTGATNSSGFSALPGGWKDDFSDSFGAAGKYAKFMSNEVLPLDPEFYSRPVPLRYDSELLYLNDAFESFKSGYSVRFIKLTETDPGYIEDYEGNRYPTIKIGNQVWLKQNWKSAYTFDGTIIPKIVDQPSWGIQNNIARCSYEYDDSNV